MASTNEGEGEEGPGHIPQELISFPQWGWGGGGIFSATE